MTHNKSVWFWCNQIEFNKNKRMFTTHICGEHTKNKRFITVTNPPFSHERKLSNQDVAFFF